MNNLSNQKYAFILGRERELALAELKAVLGRFCFDFDITSLADNVVLINSTAGEEEIAKLADVLGGTVKIFRILPPVISSGRSPVERSHEISPTSPEARGRNDNLKGQIKNLILAKSKGIGKLNYGISSYFKGYNRTFVNNLGLSIKKELKREMSLRFVALTEGIELSSIQSLKNKLDSEGMEFGLFNNEIGVLIGLSNAEEWSKRDYDKPAGDKYSGMLPPKLARMMVNLALGKIQVASSKGQVARKIENPCDSLLATCYLVVDPFCGSGNILMEAMMLGCDVFGSDNSAKAVEDTEANIKWLRAQSEKLKAESMIVQADATSQEIAILLYCYIAKGPNNTIIKQYNNIAVVTEPYLGSPKKFQSTEKAVRGEYAKIKELYLSFFMNFKNFVISNVSEKSSVAMGSLASTQNAMARDDAKNVVFCVVFPLVETLEGRRFSLFTECVDEIKKMGYILLEPPFTYGRDYQVVNRQIVLLSHK